MRDEGPGPDPERGVLDLPARIAQDGVAGKVREIAIGPKAQEVIRGVPQADNDAFLFDPREAVSSIMPPARRPASRIRALGEGPEGWQAGGEARSPLQPGQLPQRDPPSLSEEWHSALVAKPTPAHRRHGNPGEVRARGRPGCPRHAKLT